VSTRAWLLERAKLRDLTLRGLVAQRGPKVDYRAVWTFIHAEKLSFKKTVVASKRDRPDVAHRRVQWRKYQDRIEPERLVFIETSHQTWTRTVIVDKSGSRKPIAVRRFIRIADAKLFCPPKYSPDLNLIEQIFAKHKHLLHEAAARSVCGFRFIPAGYSDVKPATVPI
jgi:hypothetical protein